MTIPSAPDPIPVGTFPENVPEQRGQYGRDVLTALIRDSINARVLSDQFLNVSKYGFNGDVDTGSVPEEIWSAGGVYTFPTSASTLSIASSSAQDAVGGTGASQIYISGLASDYSDQGEFITLTGTTPVVTTLSYLRCNRSFITGAVGSNGTNVGTITITHTGGASVIAEIPANGGQTKQLIYTVPLGYTGFVKSGSFRVIDNQAGTFVEGKLQIRTNLGTFAGGWRDVVDGDALVDSPYILDLIEGGASIGEGTDIRGRVISTSSNNSVVTARLNLILWKTS